MYRRPPVFVKENSPATGECGVDATSPRLDGTPFLSAENPVLQAGQAAALSLGGSSASSAW